MSRAVRDPQPRAPTTHVRLFGFTFDRLSLRLGLGVALIVILPLGVGLLILTRRQYDRSIESRRRSAELQSRILEVALRHQMVKKDTTLTASILQEVGTQPEVLGAMILNHEGEVRVASDPSRVGERLAQSSPACLVCHDKAPDHRERWVLLKGAEGETLRSVLPIENRAVCHECHDPEKRLNGILILDTSLEHVRAETRRDVSMIVMGALVTAFLLLGGVSLFVRRSVLRRLAQLGGVARNLAEGRLDQRAEVGGRDVITALARDFNHMATSVQNLLGEIRDHEARLTNIVNSLDDGLVVLDRDSRIVACNASFARRLGRRPEEARGIYCREAGRGSLPCCRGEGECPAALCTGSREVQRVVLSTGEGDGSTSRVEEVYASPVFDSSGEVAQVVEIWRDITERVKEEEHLAEIERLVSLGVLASGFSHEVNTPLATMLTCAESVLGRLDACQDQGQMQRELPAVREAADVIRQQVLRCRKITDEFLRFSRGVPPSVELIDLAREVREVISLAAPTAREAKVELRVQAAGPLPLVRTNTEVVRHVLLSLLVNAIQSCDNQGGQIDVSFHVDDRVAIEVRDTGCGIPVEDRRHLFEPFRSRKPQGTGLGLFLSRTFMRRFGGDVQLAESRVGGGSVFRVLFVRALEPTR